ncbi:MAG: hypothetical protein VYD19_07260 [Myxococcota bacterium]|nr:hypothetical protein [Myxococcota bacterium]
MSLHFSSQVIPVASFSVGLRREISILRIQGWLFVLAFCLALSSSAKARPRESQLLSKSGDARLGQPIPHFAGWEVGTERPLSKAMLLKTPPRRGFILILGASWCAPCVEGLKRLAGARERIEQAGFKVVLLLGDSEARAAQLLQEVGLPRQGVIADRFGQSLRRLSTPARGARGKIELPRSFVLDRSGRVLRIIGREGRDYLKLLTAPARR